MSHVIIEHRLSHDYTPPFFFAPPQQHVPPGPLSPHHSHFTSRQFQLWNPAGAGPPVKVQGAYVTPTALLNLKLLQGAGLLRLHANPRLRTTDVPTTEVAQETDRVATLGELLEALNQVGFRSDAAATIGTVHVAILDDGIDRNVLTERLVAKGLAEPRLASDALCELPQLPAPYSLTGASHGGMCAFDASIFGADITLMDFPINASQSGTRIVEAAAVLEHLMSLLDTGRIGPRLVVINSWQTDLTDADEGTKTDDVGHIFNQRLLKLEASGADILFSTPSHHLNTARTIHGPAGNPGVLCVAAVDLDKRRRKRDAKGPGTMGGQKPDLTTFTCFKGYELRRGRDEGTSAANALLGGIVAALRAQGYAGTPQELRKLMSDNAIDLGDPGDDVFFGSGLADPHKALIASRP